MGVERLSKRPGSALFLAGNCLKLLPSEWKQAGKMAKGLSVCAQSANTLLQEMSPWTQLFLSALSSEESLLFTLTWKQQLKNWVGGQKHLTQLRQFSNSAARFSPRGSVIWQKGNIWKHFFIPRIAACHCCCTSDTPTFHRLQRFGSLEGERWRRTLFPLHPEITLFQAF